MLTLNIRILRYQAVHGMKCLATAHSRHILCLAVSIDNIICFITATGARQLDFSHAPS